MVLCKAGYAGIDYRRCATIQCGKCTFQKSGTSSTNKRRDYSVIRKNTSNFPRKLFSLFLPQYRIYIHAFSKKKRLTENGNKRKGKGFSFTAYVCIHEKVLAENPPESVFDNLIWRKCDSGEWWRRAYQ